MTSPSRSSSTGTGRFGVVSRLAGRAQQPGPRPLGVVVLGGKLVLLREDRRGRSQGVVSDRNRFADAQLEGPGCGPGIGAVNQNL